MYEHEYELYHYGVPGMKWGIRKVKKIVGTSGRFVKKTAGYASKVIAKQRNPHTNRSHAVNQTTNKNSNQYSAKVEKAKKAAKIGAAVAGAALAAYGAKKFNDYIREENIRSHIDKAMRIVEPRLGWDMPTNERVRTLQNVRTMSRKVADNESFVTAVKNAAKYNLIDKRKPLR